MNKLSPVIRSLKLGLLIALFAGDVCVIAAQTPAPGYNSAWKHGDGSPKLALEFAGGYDVSAGATRHTQTRGWNYLMGSGYNINRRLSLLGEYSFNHFSVPQQQIALRYGAGALSGIDKVVGDVHLWSLTLEPTFQYLQTEHLGAYVIAGGGFYRKRTLFRQSPVNCPNSNCGAPTNNLFDQSNNAAGLNFGAGFAWRVSDASNARLFAESRYTWVDNQPSLHGTTYPPAEARTGYFPVSAGVRW